MRGNILILGDQNKSGQELGNALKKATHFAVRILPIAHFSRGVVVEYKPDLIVLNPKGDCSEVMTIYYELKKEEQTKDSVVVLIVDYTQIKTADLPPGVQEVLYRPLRLDEAVVRLEHLFKRTHKINEKNLIQKGRLTMDIAKYEVSVGSKKIDLTFTEFELLKFLCSHPGVVFTREVLLNKVWGYEYYGGTRTVDVHIRRLRSKIENPRSIFIDTVRNIGYKFIVEE